MSSRAAGGIRAMEEKGFRQLQAEPQGSADAAVLSNARQLANAHTNFTSDPFNFTYLETVTQN